MLPDVENQLNARDLLALEGLEKTGHRAYLVGGCVRDLILGRPVHDVDIATSAAPEAVTAVFSSKYRVIPTGIRHGTVTVLIKGTPYEITTFRAESGYSDSRHPDNVSYLNTIEEDLARRDFTINAIAWHPADGFIDPFDGISDIRSGTIRAVRDPDERFREDALRMMRAVRFSAQLGFVIEAETLHAITRNADGLRLIAKERIRDELCKILASDHPSALSTLHETGLLSRISPDLDAIFGLKQNHPWHCFDLAGHTMEAIKHIEADPILRTAMLLHDIGKIQTKTTDERGVDHFYGHQARSAEMAEEFLREYRFSKREIYRILPLVRYHDELASVSTEEALRKQIRSFVFRHRNLPDQFFLDFLRVREADYLAHDTTYEKAREYAPVLEVLKEELPKYIRINEGDDPLPRKISDLAITGNDLKPLVKAKMIGGVLERLLRVVIDDPKKNDASVLLSLAAEERKKK